MIDLILARLDGEYGVMLPYSLPVSVQRPRGQHGEVLVTLRTLSYLTVTLKHQLLLSDEQEEAALVQAGLARAGHFRGVYVNEDILPALTARIASLYRPLDRAGVLA